LIQADHDFFSDFSDLKYFPDYRPGSRIGVISQLYELDAYKYSPGMLFKYKLCHGDEWEVFPKQIKKKLRNQRVKYLQLHDTKLAVDPAKLRALLDLLLVLPKDCHGFCVGIQAKCC
jgi:hypothetical protein